MGKVVNHVKLTIPSQSQLHFGGKDRKSCKITKFGCFDPIKSTFLAKFAIVGDFEPYWCEMIQKSWKPQKSLPIYTPPSKLYIFIHFRS